jgi:fatty acid desaturase
MFSIKEFITAFVLGIIVGALLSGLIVSIHWQSELVKHDCAHYGFSTTGDTILIWNK